MSFSTIQSCITSAQEGHCQNRLVNSNREELTSQRGRVSKMKKCLAVLVLVGLISMPVFAIQLTEDNDDLFTGNFETPSAFDAGSGDVAGPSPVGLVDAELSLATTSYAVSSQQLQSIIRNSTIVNMPLQGLSTVGGIDLKTDLNVQKYVLALAMQRKEAAGATLSQEAEDIIAGKTLVNIDELREAVVNAHNEQTAQAIETDTTKIDASLQAMELQLGKMRASLATPGTTAESLGMTDEEANLINTAVSAEDYIL